MKILYAGNLNVSHGSEYYISKYLTKAGHDVTEFIYPSFDKDFKQINMLLFRMINDINPDFILFGKCPGLTYNDIMKLRSTGQIVVQWIFDKMSNVSDMFQKNKITSRESWWIPQAKAFNLVLNPEFKMHKKYIDKGINHKILLEGVDPEIFFPEKQQKKHDVVFVGSLHTRFRQEFVPYFETNFNFSHITKTYTDELRTMLNESKMSLCSNFDDRPECGFSVRIFEHMACDVLCLHPYKKGMVDIGFEDKKNIVFYNKNDKDDLVTKFRYYLSHDNEREQIIRNQNELSKQFTWDKRIKEFMELLKRDGLIL